MANITLQLECENLGKYDVIVAGGGLAGAAAALAVAREGKRVMLIEKSQKLGGLGTLGLINLFVPMCNGRGKQIIFGMAEEFLRLSTKYSWDTIPEGWEQGGEYQGPEPQDGNYPRYVNRYSPDIFALTLTEVLADAGVELMFDTIVTRPVMEDKHCKGLVVENKSGMGYYEAN
ncbi:MAG: FAD-dependent oxidoreductase, partial [Clostridia bacterium]|nr:FAD-dependent oxidoreductase [Clostridia bacterium]